MERELAEHKKEIEALKHAFEEMKTLNALLSNRITLHETSSTLCAMALLDKIVMLETKLSAALGKVAYPAMILPAQADQANLATPDAPTSHH